MKGRKKPGVARPENYDCCGPYVRQGNAGCRRALVRQGDLEEVVLGLAQEIVLNPDEGRGEIIFYAIPRFAERLWKHKEDVTRRRRPLCESSGGPQLRGGEDIRGRNRT